MTEQQVQFGIEWAEEQEKFRNTPNYKPTVNINGYVLDADVHEDTKRALLFAVFDVLDMDWEAEFERYKMYQEKYPIRKTDGVEN